MVNEGRMSMVKRKPGCKEQPETFGDSIDHLLFASNDK